MLPYLRLTWHLEPHKGYLILNTHERYQLVYAYSQRQQPLSLLVSFTYLASSCIQTLAASSESQIYDQVRDGVTNKNPHFCLVASSIVQ